MTPWHSRITVEMSFSGLPVEKSCLIDDPRLYAALPKQVHESIEELVVPLAELTPYADEHIFLRHGTNPFSVFSASGRAP